MEPVEYIVMAHVNRQCSRAASEVVRRWAERTVPGHPTGPTSRLSVFMPRHLDVAWIRWADERVFCASMPVADRRSVVFCNAGISSRHVQPELVFDMAIPFRCARIHEDDAPHSDHVDARQMGQGMTIQACRQCGQPRRQLIQPCKCFQWEMENPIKRVKVIGETVAGDYLDDLLATCCSRTCVSRKARLQGAIHLAGLLCIFNPFECTLTFSRSWKYHEFQRLYWNMGISSVLTLYAFDFYIAQLQHGILKETDQDQAAQKNGKLEHEAESNVDARTGLAGNDTVED